MAFYVYRMITSWKNLSFMGTVGKEAEIRGTQAVLGQQLEFVAVFW